MLVTPGEAEPLAAAMLALARDRDRAAAMGTAARARAIERFPEGRCTERTEEVYRFWLNGGRNGSLVSAAAARSASTKSHGTR